MDSILRSKTRGQYNMLSPIARESVDIDKDTWRQILATLTIYTINGVISMSASEKALDIQEIDKYIDKLSDLGFEFMYYNRISSIRRIRVGRARR